MDFCPYCGCEIDAGTTCCPSCGSELEPTPVTVNRTVSDNGGFGWSLRGCCLPIVALILYFVWHNTKPKTAQALCSGAIVGVIIFVVILIASFVLGFFAVGQLLDWALPYIQSLLR